MNKLELIKEKRAKIINGHKFTYLENKKPTITNEALLLEEKDLARLIIEFVCGHYNIPMDKITNCTRKQEVVKARQQSMYLIYNFTGLVERQIGDMFGKNHATIAHSKKTVVKDCSYPPYLAEYEDIESSVFNLFNNFKFGEVKKTTHELKVWPVYFNEIFKCRKNFDIRKNDRNFKVGDTITFMEWDPSTESYTGRHCHREISYIMGENPFVTLGENVILSIV